MTQVKEGRMAELEASITKLLDAPTYALSPQERHDALLAVLKQEIEYACERNAKYANYARQWPVRVADAKTVAELPYLPVSAFKANPPLSLVDASEIKRTLTSSSTSGQVPSRVVLDAATSRRMTKGVIAIIRDFIGAARRPYLVIDTQENLGHQAELGARGAAIQALGSFATETVSVLRAGENGEPALDLEKLLACAEKWKGSDVIVYGFTYVIWTQLVEPLKKQGITLNLPNVHVLHSGGWKRLEQRAVTKNVFCGEVAKLFGCAENRVIDYYGMVENVGVVYPDCERGYKHVPAFADVIVRDPLTLAPLGPGRPGLVQVASALPTSFPGFLLLTDDMGEIVGEDGCGCGCGRRGTHFRFLKRVPKVEVRGCGNLETTRGRSAVGTEVK
jgi:phenylacetate-coenzyme A ligase PaaK-like adenylate-forming protein